MIQKLKSSKSNIYEYPLHIHMVSVNISIRKEAYNFLSSLKGKDKSFSDVILEFRNKEDNILQFFGKLKDVDWKEQEKRMKKFRKSFDERLK